jgi:predicted lactoylglutathione lyase
MIVGESLCGVPLTHDKFKIFTPNLISDAQMRTAILVCLSLHGRHKGDSCVRNAVAAVGNVYKPLEDHGFIYGCGLQDLNGHIGQLIDMDMAVFHKAQQGA